QQLLQPLALAAPEVDGAGAVGRAQPADQLPQPLGRHGRPDRMAQVGDVEDLGPFHPATLQAAHAAPVPPSGPHHRVAHARSAPSVSTSPLPLATRSAIATLRTAGSSYVFQ